MDDPTNYDALKFWLDVVQWVFTIGVMIFVWIDRGRSDNHNLIKQLADRQEALERRLITAEEQMRHLPTHDDIAKLREEYSGLNSKVDRMAITLDRIHDHLINKGI
ncbi:DUF2730 family protein [Marinobacterium stanieri]|uniref:DUF2730 family protein n=1 Tax=Marinobacterium stanieri TaxID=49186 RepID=UPI000255885C|nr:DUF2730 family protein [Marinobacterium stanieri]